MKNVIKLNFKCRDPTVRSSVKNRSKATDRLWWARFVVLRTAYRLTGRNAVALRPVRLSSEWLWFLQIYLVTFYRTVSVLNIDFHFPRCVVSLSSHLRHQSRWNEVGSQGQVFPFEIRDTGLSKRMDGIWNRYNLKSTGRIYTFGVLKYSEKCKVLDLL